MRDLDKAKTLISDRSTNLKELSMAAKIPYPTLKHYSADLTKLDNAKASRVNLLAKIYDKVQLEKAGVNIDIALANTIQDMLIEYKKNGQSDKAIKLMDKAKLLSDKSAYGKYFHL